MGFSSAFDLGGAILSRSERYEPRGRPNSRWWFSTPDLRKWSRVGWEYRVTSRVARRRRLALRREGVCGLTFKVLRDGDLDLRLALQRVAHREGSRSCLIFSVIQKNVPRYLYAPSQLVD